MAYLDRMEKEHEGAKESFQKRAEDVLRIKKLEGQINFGFIVMQQIMKVLLSISEEEYIAEVKKLFVITPSSWKQTDQQFLKDFDEAQKTMKRSMDECEELNNGSEVEEADLCDVDPIEYFDDVFSCLINLYDRKGLLIEHKRRQVSV